MKGMILFMIVINILTVTQTGFCNQPNEKWQEIGCGIDEVDLKSIAINPQNPEIIYLGSAKSIFKTADGGKTWQKVYMVRGTLTAVNAITIDPMNTNVVYAGTQNGLYKSLDGGTNWAKAFEGTGEKEKDIKYILIDLANSKRIYTGTGSGIFITNDAGAMWNKLANEISNQSANFIVQDPVNTDIIYVAADTGVFKSSNHNRSFERIFIATAQTNETEIEEGSQDINTDETATHSNKTPNCLAIDNQDNNKIYIGTNSGVFVSSDTGKTWTKLTNSGLTNNKIASLTCTKDNLLYTATKNGIFKISQPYQKWDEVYSGLPSKDARLLAYNQSDNFILAATEKGVYKSNPNPINPDDNYANDEETARIMTRFKSEPSIQEVQDMAIKYAEVHNEKIKEWRKSAKRKALLPEVSVGIDESEGDYYYGGTWKGTEGDTGWDLSLTWDLGDLIWNDDQNNIDVRSRLMVQLRDDILNEITRLYFERRRLQIELFTNPSRNLHVKLEKDLRLQELTAGVDALTGGWFSKRIKEASGNPPS